MDTISISIKTREGEETLTIPFKEEFLTWKDITKVYIQALNGLGYTLPEDFENSVL